MYFELKNERCYAATGHQALDPDQPTIVFIHGAGMSHLVWAVNTRYFAHNGFNVLSLDLPGHGHSAGALRPTIEAMATWVAEVIAQFGISTCRLVGHSMGSLVALETAARSNVNPSHVALIGFTYPMVVGPPLLEAAKNNDPAAIDMMVIWGHDYAQQIGGNPVPGVRVLNLAERWLQRAAPGVLFNDLNACNEYAGAEQALAKLSCPVSLIMGTKDRMTPAKIAAATSQQFANVHYLPIDDCGHGCMLEQPEQTHRYLVEAVGAD